MRAWVRISLCNVLAKTQAKKAYSQNAIFKCFHDAAPPPRTRPSVSLGARGPASLTVVMTTIINSTETSSLLPSPAVARSPNNAQNM